MLERRMLWVRRVVVWMKKRKRKMSRESVGQKVVYSWTEAVAESWLGVWPPQMRGMIGRKIGDR